MKFPEYAFVLYHSFAWYEMVEQGWMTIYVYTNGFAQMYRQLRCEVDKPRYVHDCDQCIFLGGYEKAAIHYDLYYCEKCDSGSVIARCGNEGYNYISMPIFALIYAGLLHDNPCVEALYRQIKRWQNR